MNYLEYFLKYTDGKLSTGLIVMLVSILAFVVTIIVNVIVNIVITKKMREIKKSYKLKKNKNEMIISENLHSIKKSNENTTKSEKQKKKHNRTEILENETVVIASNNMTSVINNDNSTRLLENDLETRVIGGNETKIISDTEVLEENNSETEVLIEDSKGSQTEVLIDDEVPDNKTEVLVLKEGEELDTALAETTVLEESDSTETQILV